MLSPKSFVKAAAVLSLVTMVGCSSQPSVSGKVNIPVVEKKPERILVLGNSIAYQLGTSISAALGSNGVEVRNEAAPEIAVWGEKSPLMDSKAEYERLVRDFDPDIVLVTTVFAKPASDCAPMTNVVDDCNRAAIKAADLFLGKQLVDVLSANGAKVVWMRYPYPGSFYEKRSATIQETGEIADNTMIELSASDPRLYVIDYRSTVNAPGEDFTLWLKTANGYRQSRAFDGLHLCQYGAELVANLAAPLLYPGFDTSPSSTWRTGEWRKDPIFSLRVFNGDPQCIDKEVQTPIPSPLESK